MFGSHLSIAGGMHKALLAAEGYGMETVQVFTKNQQQWVARPLEEEAVKMFRGEAERLGFRAMVSHASYLINLASNDEMLWEKSIAAFADEMKRCDQLGIAHLVIHPGAHCGSGEACGIDRVIQAINRLLREPALVKGKVTICLETTAGQGSCLGCTFEHLAEMITGVEQKDRMGVCVDTCHILAAGYDITTEAGTQMVLEKLDQVVGLKRVKAWHLNDSKKPLGSRVDRHEHIGQGYVGLAAFGVICRDARMKNVPKILETPKEKAPNGEDWDMVNLGILKKVMAGKRPRLIKST